MTDASRNTPEPFNPLTNQTIVDAFTINTSGVVGQPKVLTRADGTFFAAYATPDGTGTFLIKGQAFDATGQKLGGEVTFDTDRTPIDQSDFDIEILPTGQVAVTVHVDSDDPENEIALVSAVFDFSDGSDPVVVSQQPLSAPDNAEVYSGVTVGTSDGYKTYFIARTKDGITTVQEMSVEENGAVSVRIVSNFNRNRNAELDAAALNNSAAPDRGSSVMILDRNGDDDSGDGRIQYKVFGQDGRVIRTGEAGNRNTNTYDVTVTGVGVFGGFVIAWTEDDGFDTDVQFQTFSGLGAPFGGVRTVGDSGASSRDNNNEPTIVALDDRGFIIFYDDDNGDNRGINGQRYNSNGQEVGEVFRISNEGFAPDATLTPNGEVVVTYRTASGELKVEIIQTKMNLINGTDGDDTLLGTSEGDIIRGFEGDDRVVGFYGDDELHGGDGNDVLIGGAGDDTMFGGAGSDRFIFRDGEGNDVIREFDATDDAEQLFLTAISEITDFADLVENHMTQVGTDVLIDFGGGNSVRLTGVDITDLDPADFRLRFNSINGTDDDETLTGTDGDDVIRGLDGDDVIIGGKGDDILFGGAGSDTFVFFDGDGNDEIRGFNATNDGEKIDLRGITSVTGFDMLLNNYMQQAGDDVVIDFGTGDTITLRAVQLSDLGVDDFIFNDQAINGTDGDDTLLGTAGDDTIRGFEGDDRVVGFEGDDELHGGDGNDVLIGGAGDDTMFGGAGSDRFIFRDGEGNDVIREFDATDDAEQLFLTAISEITDFADLRDNHMTQVGTDVLIDFGGGNSVRLTGVDITDLDAADFRLRVNNTDDRAAFDGFGEPDMTQDTGNDAFDSGAGDDVFFAEVDSETFVFVNGFGNDTIIGFGADDVLDLSAVSSIESFLDLSADHIRQEGDDLIIDDLAGNTITLEGMTAEDLSEDNVLF